MTCFSPSCSLTASASCPSEHPVLLELYNPKGQLIHTGKPARSLDAFHSFRIDTDEVGADRQLEGPRADRRHWLSSRTLKIETVVPNRLKINFQPGRRQAAGRRSR